MKKLLDRIKKLEAEKEERDLKDERLEIKKENKELEKKHPCPDREAHCWHSNDTRAGWHQYAHHCCYCGGQKSDIYGRVTEIVIPAEHGEHLNVEIKNEH